MNTAALLATLDPRAASAESLRRSFSGFFRASWHVHEPATPLMWGWPYEVVCDHLQALVEDWAQTAARSGFVQRFRNLLATLPPGFLKSRLLVAYVPWIAEERAKGERRWAKLYQGRPAPATGAMVKLADLRFWRHDADPPVAASPKECYQGPAVVLPRQMDAIVIAGDLAGGKLTAKGEYNALVVVGCKGAKLFLLESWVKRAGFPEVQAKVRELSASTPARRRSSSPPPGPLSWPLSRRRSAERWKAVNKAITGILQPRGREAPIRFLSLKALELEQREHREAEERARADAAVAAAQRDEWERLEARRAAGEKLSTVEKYRHKRLAPKEAP
ncbi:MAG: hypothetical protein KF773_42515 [Deltaproteobacteria bacterium]|nr:hypothetical protein [Deltaproteobacteria bacterium]